MKDNRKLIRCINLDTNKVKYFPSEIVYNQWWQKNTRFIPQELDLTLTEPTIINTQDEMLEVASIVATSIVDATSNIEVKQKRKYKKRKSNGDN